jgi:hypothetical protein
MEGDYATAATAAHQRVNPFALEDLGHCYFHLRGWGTSECIYMAKKMAQFLQKYFKAIRQSSI